MEQREEEKVCKTCNNCMPYHNHGHLCLCNFKIISLSGICKDWEEDENNIKERIVNKSW